MASHKSDHAPDHINASDAGRQHEDDKPHFQRLRSLIRPKQKRTQKLKHIRTGSSDWGADEVGDFCTPNPEEYFWNQRRPSERVDHRHGVMIDEPIPDDNSAIDDEVCIKEVMAMNHTVREQRAVAGTDYHSGSDEEQRSGRRYRRLVKDERRMLRLREDLRRIVRRQNERGRRTKIRRGGVGDGGLFGDGIDDGESGDADDEG